LPADGVLAATDTKAKFAWNASGTRISALLKMALVPADVVGFGPGGPLHSTSGDPVPKSVAVVKLVGSTATVMPLTSWDKVVAPDGVAMDERAFASGVTAVAAWISSTPALLLSVSETAVLAVQTNVPLLEAFPNPVTTKVAPTKALFAPLP